MAFNSQASALESSFENSPLLKAFDTKSYGGSEESSLSSDSSSDLSSASTPIVDAETAPRIEDVSDISKQLSARKHVAKTISILLIGMLIVAVGGSDSVWSP